MRYILTYELARLCAELAYSPQDELTQCLDLVRLPAESLWIEWNEAAELVGSRKFFEKTPLEVSAPGSRAGIHIRSSAIGRRAQLRFVFSKGAEALLSPFEATIDFEDRPFRECPLGDLLQGGWAALTDLSPTVAQLLTVARFRLEPSWATYYRDAARSSAQYAVVGESLGGPARTIPFLIR